VAAQLDAAPSGSTRSISPHPVVARRPIERFLTVSARSLVAAVARITLRADDLRLVVDDEDAPGRSLLMPAGAAALQ
jgi:hypothetical protein